MPRRRRHVHVGGAFQKIYIYTSNTFSLTTVSITGFEQYSRNYFYRRTFHIYIFNPTPKMCLTVPLTILLLQRATRRYVI